MADIKALVELLADGAFHSGEEVGAQLGVSRAAVWKQLQKLDNYGVPVESIKGRGYRLAEKLELLSIDLLVEKLGQQRMAQLTNLEVLFDVESTSDWAVQKLRRGEAGRGYCCLAEFQRQGRGRRGRQWFSPLASNITLSLVWEFEEGAASLGGLSLAIGVAMVRALRSQGLMHVQLKWPNDILIEGSKLGGILLEMQGDPAGVCQVVIGIGINAHMKRADGLIGQPWTALSEHLSHVSRNQLAAAMINELLELLLDFPNGGFAALRHEWMSCDAYRGQEVELIAGDNCQKGLVVGVADDGALLLDIDGEQIPFHGGEISLRPVSGS